MEVNIIRNKEEFESLKGIWNGLLERSPFNSVFQTFEWYNTWYETCSGTENASLYIITFSKKNEIKGIAPFMSVHEDNEDVLKFLSQPYPDYQDIIVDKKFKNKFIKLLIRELLSNKEDFSRIKLKQFPSYSPTYIEFHNQFRLRDYASDIKNDLPCPRINYSEVEDIGNTERKCTDKYIKKINEDFGSIQFNFITEESKLKDVLEILIKQHIKRWEEHESHPNGSRLKKDHMKQFYFALMEDLSHEKWVNITTINCEDSGSEEPLATCLGFLYDGHYTQYCPSFDIEYYDYYTGLILWRKLIK